MADPYRADLLSQRQWPLAAGGNAFAEARQWMALDQSGLKGRAIKASASSAIDVVEALIAMDTPQAREVAVHILEYRVAAVSAPDWEAIDRHGVTTPETRAELERLRFLVYEYALLYVLTSEDKWRESTLALLLRLGESYPSWPLRDREGNIHSQHSRSYLRMWNANGLWGRWHPLDLASAYPLLKAYDTLRPVMPEEKRRQIERQVFEYHKEHVDRYPTLADVYHNLMGTWLVSMIYFSRVMERPEYMHEVIDYWREFIRYSYTPDGFFREVTPAYHRMITRRMAGTIPSMLDGYSDPEGWVHPVSGLRYDEFQPLVKEEDLISRMNGALALLALPNRTYAGFNDTEGDVRVPGDEAAEAAVSGLLGIAGIARIGDQDSALFMQFGGIRGHDHDDALNLLWFTGGKEVFSEGGYRPLPGSDSTREWQTITASHFTVAIDETRHFSARGQVQLPGRSGATTAQPLNTPGAHAIEPILPAAAAFNNQGRLLLWRGEGEVQAMEAEQPAAYPGLAERFRRTVVLLTGAVSSPGHSVMVDLFRVSGGRTHDYFLRGGLDHAYTLTADIDIVDYDGSAYEYIQLHAQGEVLGAFTVQADYPDGHWVRSNYAGMVFEPMSSLSWQLGWAPGIRRVEQAPFSFLRNQSGSESAPLESHFAWVHESGMGEPQVTEVAAFELDDDCLVLGFFLGDEQWLVLSGSDDNSRLEIEDISFTGRLAVFSKTEPGDWMVRLYDGSALTIGGRDYPPTRKWEGRVARTLRREAGDSSNALWITDYKSPKSLESSPFRLAHIDMGQGVRFSIPIDSVEISDTGAKVHLRHSPGFEVQPEAVHMTQFPGWRIVGEARVTLTE